MWNDEQSAEGRVLRVGKKDSPNWFMLAGGAIVMAISVALGRRKILREGEMVKKKVPSAGAGISVVTHEGDETCSVTRCRSKCEAKMQQFMTCKSALSEFKTLEANLEVKRLHRQLNSLRINPTTDVDEVCIDVAVAGKRQQDVEKLVLEARKSLETVECLEREREARLRLMQVKSRQCELLYKKVSILTTELEEVKAAAQEKQQLLETKEEENFKLASLLQELQHKVEIEHRSNEWVRSSKLSNQTNTKNKQSSWKRNYDVDHATPTIYKEPSKEPLSTW